MATELDEETRRLIKLFRPAKDAETSWRIDVSAELAWYLDMLQQEDARSAPGAENVDHLSNGLASVIAYEGINFSQASAVVMEATRVFSRKVDFLRKQMDSTLTNILTGGGAQTKKSKQRKQRAGGLGALSLPEWELPHIPDSSEFMHLPLEKLTGFTTYTPDNGKHIIPLEKKLHQLHRAEPRPSAALAQHTEVLSEDEVMAEDAEPRGDALRTETPSVGEYPVCENLRDVAILKRQIFSRPNVHLLAPVQINPTLADSSFHFTALQFFKTHATTRAIMDCQGVLSFSSYHKLFESSNLGIGTNRFSCSPKIGGGECATESGIPAPSTLRSQAPSAAFGGLASQLITPQVPTTKPRAKRPTFGAVEPEFHNEHEAIGRDLPLKVGNTIQKIQISLYTQSLESVCKSLNSKLDQPDFLDCLFVALTGSYGVERVLGTSCTKQSTLPFFTDIRRAPSTSSAFHFDWNLPPKERVITRPQQSNQEAYEDSPVFGADMSGDGGMMGDELDDARLFDGDAGFNGSESVQLVDTFSRLDGRLSILGGRDTLIRHARPSAANGMSQMHERIGVWRQRVEQWMTVAANEESFDIPTYIRRIRDVKTEVAANALTLPNVENNSVNSVSFRAVCKGAKRHEVCRLFLTSLLLVNRYGLDIAQEDVTDFRLDLERLADQEEDQL